MKIKSDIKQKLVSFNEHKALLNEGNHILTYDVLSLYDVPLWNEEYNIHVHSTSFDNVIHPANNLFVDANDIPLNVVIYYKGRDVLCWEPLQERMIREFKFNDLEKMCGDNFSIKHFTFGYVYGKTSFHDSPEIGTYQMWMRFDLPKIPE